MSPARTSSWTTASPSRSDAAPLSVTDVEGSSFWRHRYHGPILLPPLYTTDESTALTIPMFTPSPPQLRVGATWIVISNWADGLAERYGRAEIVTGDATLTPAEARAVSWSSTTAAVTAPATTAPRGTHLRTMVKDGRWLTRATGLRLDTRRYRPHDVPFVWQYHIPFQRAGYDLARRMKIPIVLMVDAPVVWEAESWGVQRPGWGHLLERFGESPQFRAADAIACVTEEVADAVVERGGHADRIVITPGTANPEAYRRATPQRSQLGLDGRTVVGWVGSFRRFHRVDQLVRAAAAADPDGRSLSLLMVGDGPTKAESEQLAEDLGVHAVFTGSVANTEVPAFVASMDAGVILAGPDDQFHYSPLKLKEYLAAGIATVVPGVGEMGREMTHGVDTYMFDPGNEEQLAQRLAELTASAEQRSAIADAGARLFDDRFTIGQQLDAIEEIIGWQRPHPPPQP